MSIAFSLDQFYAKITISVSLSVMVTVLIFGHKKEISGNLVVGGHSWLCELSDCR